MKKSISKDTQGHSLIIWGSFPMYCLPGNREAVGSVWRRGGETVHTHLLPGVNVALDIIRKLPKDV